MLLAAVVGCGKEGDKVTAPVNPVVKPADKPTDTGTGGTGGASAPPVKP
jgi:hypothetical protein